MAIDALDLLLPSYAGAEFVHCQAFAKVRFSWAFEFKFHILEGHVMSILEVNAICLAR